jgi:hypothetical protein
MSLGSLVVELSANVAKFQSDLGKADQIAQDAAKRIDEKFGLVKNTLATFGVGLASAFTFDAIEKKIEGVISAAAGLKELSERTGGTVENLSALAGVAKLSGTDTDALAGGLQKLSKSMVDAERGSAKTTAAFSALGIGTKNLAQQKPEDIFLQVATQLAKYQDGAAKTALAQELLGKSGANLLPVMKDLADVGSYQAKVTTEQAEQALAYEKNLTRLHASTDAIFKKVGLELIPVFDAFTKALLDAQNAQGGLRATVEGLAKDGSIRDWAERAAVGLAYFIDVLSIVPDLISMLGKTLAAAAAQFVGLAQAVKGAGQILSGDFTRGVETARAGLAQIKNVGAAWSQDMQGIWNKPLFSDRLKKQLEDAKNSAEKAAKPQLPNLPVMGGATTEVLKKQLDGQLKLLEGQVQQEQQIFQAREQFLSRFYGEDLISIADYFAARRVAVDEHLKNTLAAYDKEVAALKAYQAQVSDAKAKIEAQNRIQEVGDKAQKAVSAAQTQSQMLYLDQAKAAKAYADEIERLNIRLLELQGNLAEASRRQTALQDRPLRQRATVEGDSGALATLDRVEELTRAHGALNGLNQQAALIEQQLATTEGRVNLERQRGAITELDSLARLGVARQDAAEKLQKIGDEMTAVAQAAGDPRMVANAEAFRLKVDSLAASANVLGQKFQTVFENGMATFLEDLVNRTKSFKDAFLDMARGIEQAITRIVAQNLAQSLFGGSGASGGAGTGVGGFLAGLFGGGSAGAGSGAGFFGLKLAGAMAGGGEAYANQSYLVGENGPEIFTPKTSGTVIPHERLGILSAGSNGTLGAGAVGPTGGTVMHVQNHFHLAQPADRRTQDQIAALAGGAIRRALARNS